MIKEAEKYLRIGKEGRTSLIGYYNRFCYPEVAPNRKYRMGLNDNWCAMFTTVIAHKCGLGSDKFPYEVSVFYQVQIAKKRGKFFTDYKLAKPNDLIIFSWNNNGVFNHVGFVHSITGNKVKTIEGNINNTVGYRTVNGDAMAVVGFIRTDYEEVVVNANEEDKRIRNLAVRAMRGEFGNGIQRVHNLKGDFRHVQDMINKIMRGE